MDNLQNTSAEGTQTSTEGTQKSGKIFTQEDVNRIVQERLAKEKNKASGNEELDQRTAELDKRAADLEAKENRLNTLEILRSAGYPDELADVIRCGNSEELKILSKRGPRKAGAKNWMQRDPVLLVHPFICRKTMILPVSERLWG